MILLQSGEPALRPHRVLRRVGKKRCRLYSVQNRRLS
jgi:hypothetical protein